MSPFLKIGESKLRKKNRDQNCGFCKMSGLKLHLKL
jgi:hypothetical protein